MYIYKLYIFLCYLLNTVSYKIYDNGGKRLQLYMKKTKFVTTPLYLPKSFRQEEYVKYLNNDKTKIIISTGPAGCGKTLFACQKAISLLKTEEIHKIIITRPVVSVDEEIGFLPGNLIKKMDPWTKPIFDIFLEQYSKIELDVMLMNGKIEICPLAFMRGRTFKRSFIIADEMQNSSPNQMKMLTTRLGEYSRMVITGDLQQSDSIKDNGLHDIVNKLNLFNETSDIIKTINFNNTDIERSDIVKKVIEIYEYNPTTINIQNNTTSIEDNIIYIKENEDYKDKKNQTDKKNINDDAALIPIQHMLRNLIPSN